MVHDFVGFGDAVAGKPVNHVGLAAHRTDFDDLLQSNKMRGNPAVDRIGEFAVVAAQRFDNGGGVDAGGGAEGVAAERRDNSAG